MSRTWRVFAAAVLAAVIGLQAGCAVNQATASRVAGADLSKVHRIYVVTEPGDDHQIDQLIAAWLRQRGYQVTVGFQQDPPWDADAAVTYVDKWMWDITMYMLQLKVTMRDGQAFPLAHADSLHTSLTRKSPQEMVDEAMANLMAAK